MKISEIKEIIKAQLDMSKEDRIVLCLEGQQGIGKTQAIQQVAKDNGWDYKALYGAQAQVEDLMGIPQKNEETGETVFAKPVFLPSKEKTIFVLEEINRAQLDVQQAVLQLLTDKKIGPHELPKNTLIIISINPAGDNNIYNVDELDPVFINRICTINIEADKDDWVRYAINNNFNDKIINFINNDEKWLSVKPTVDKTGKALPSPRTWELASKILKMVEKNNNLESSLIDILSGVVGRTAATTFISRMDRPIPVKGEEIVKNYDDSIKSRLNNQNASELYFTRLDLISYLNKNISNINKNEIENILKALTDINENKSMEFISSFISEYTNDKFEKLLGYNNIDSNLVNKVLQILDRINVEYEK